MSSDIRRVLYLAAHGGFGGQAIPLGGGAAVANLLQAEWAGTRPFEVELVGPAALGESAPGGREIVTFNEHQYAVFCDAFQAAATSVALQHDPQRTAILVNDISEGPDFERLRDAGFRIVTVYHVDVVAYIAAIYLRGRLRPKTLTRGWEWVRRLQLDKLAPRILRLIFAQQRASLEHSDVVVVPSSGMKETLLECYPDTPPHRIRVLPWGAPPADCAPEQARDAAEELRREFEVPGDAQILLCLSRISPEKGQDRLLTALAEWERSGTLPDRPIWLFICGEPAFMQGQKHMQKLRRLAAKLERIRVVFPGYASGTRKQGFFALADLYVFPSRHESYGLTLMEALAAGLPAVCLDHQGSREVMRPEIGRMLGEGESLQGAIQDLLSDNQTRREMGAAARQYAAARPFAESAACLAEWLLEQSQERGGRMSN
ncbi:MAG: glycosyltransferase family 4 protein [Bryobacterales bacterium]|nr:glycosyltransferase family 4 protein [Bryobacterales bacterium]